MSFRQFVKSQKKLEKQKQRLGNILSLELELGFINQ
jgi:hypothetical protein